MGDVRCLTRHCALDYHIITQCPSWHRLSPTFFNAHAHAVVSVGGGGTGQGERQHVVCCRIENLRPNYSACFESRTV